MIAWKDIRYPGIVLPGCLDARNLLQTKLVSNSHIVWAEVQFHTQFTYTQVYSWSWNSVSVLSSYMIYHCVLPVEWISLQSNIQTFKCCSICYRYILSFIPFFLAMSVIEWIPFMWDWFIHKPHKAIIFSKSPLHLVSILFTGWTPVQSIKISLLEWASCWRVDALPGYTPYMQNSTDSMLPM